MAGKVYVHSLEILNNLQNELSQFNFGTRKVLSDVDHGIEVARQHLESRWSYWHGELQRREAALRLCQSYRDHKGNYQNCSREAAAVHEAQEAIEKIKKLFTKLEQAVGQYQPNANQMMQVLDATINKAKGDLQRSIEKYRDYLDSTFGVTTYSVVTTRSSNSARSGSDFEAWVLENIFGGQAKRISIHLEDNIGVSMTKDYRILDYYWREDGSLWELKAGYQMGNVNRDQVEDLLEMLGEDLEGKHIYAREGGKKIRIPINSVNYLFDTIEGAKANFWAVSPARVWFIGDDGTLQLYE